MIEKYHDAFSNWLAVTKSIPLYRVTWNLTNSCGEYIDRNHSHIDIQPFLHMQRHLATASVITVVQIYNNTYETYLLCPYKFADLNEYQSIVNC